MSGKTHLKKGDEIKILSGKDAGRHGKILKVMPEKNQVILEGLNLVKKHTKPSKTNPQGGVIDKALPLNVAKIMVICPGCNKPTRIRRERAVDGTLVRTCRHCNRTLD